MYRVIALVIVVSLSMGIVPSAGASASKLSNELLSINQMPIGWSVVHLAGSGSVSGCISAQVGPKPSTKSTVIFADGGGLPELYEGLASYGSTSVAMIQNALHKKIEALDHCQRVTTSGKKTTVHIGRMSFPRFGNQSAAYVFTAATNGVNDELDVLVARVGKIVAVVMEADISPVNVSQFQGFVVQALAKMK